MIASPEIAIGLTGTFVILSQIKINVTNAYAGSIAWSNFFSRLTHRPSGPGGLAGLQCRHRAGANGNGHLSGAGNIFWGFTPIFAVAWVGAIVADLVINKPLGLSPKHIEFKRAHLYDINPVGVGSMLVASILVTAAHFGWLGETAQALASFLALGTAFVLAPVIAFRDRRKILPCPHARFPCR